VGRDGIRCFKTPVHRDERHLVGYTGPPPGRYPRPEPPQPKLYAPDAVTYWVKDAELLPEPAPVPPGRRVAPPPLRNTVSHIERESLPPDTFDRKPVRKTLQQSSTKFLQPLANGLSEHQPGTLLESERQAVLGSP